MLKRVDFFLNSAILFSVREIKNNMKNETTFLNVVFNVKRNPEYKGNHQLADFDAVHTTFSLGTTKQEMIDQFLAEIVVKDIHGKTWIKGEMIQVVSIEKCFEDRF